MKIGEMRIMIRVGLAALSLLLIAGCAADASEDEASGQSEDAILGGRVEANYPAVGMLRWATAFGTGTLISPNVVLTAAHVAAGKPTKFLYGTPAAGKAPQEASLKSVPVAEILIHPCYASPKADPACKGEVIDVALVRLAQPITDVAPVPVVDRPLEYLWGTISPYEGDSCTAVGFGAHLDGNKVSMGTRRSAKSTIDSVDATELVAVWGTGLATGGDSGGPLLCAGRIVGTVRGSSAPVPKSSIYTRTREGYERTDLWRTWIREQLVEWG